MITREVEVLVVGMGPVGSVAALALARSGISTAVIEVKGASATDLRASTFHAPTLEMLDALGVADVLLDTGLKAPEYQYRDRKSGEIFKFDLTELADLTKFPFRIQREQHVLAQHVSSVLETLAEVHVAHNARLLYLEQDEDKVVAYVETDRAVERYVAKFVIGADGANSVTRKLLGLDFAGFTWSDKYLCLSTETPIEQHLEGLCYVNYISDPDEWMVLLKVPSLWRVLVPAEETDDDAMLVSDQNKDAVFSRILGDKTLVKTHHRTVYRVHQRVCERFAVGRVALVGDAAHLNSPMGGFGMNSGIHDAINLVEKLCAILRDGQGLELLALYDRQRRTITNDFVQAQTIENTNAMKMGWDSARQSRRTQMEHLVDDAAARRAYLMRQSMFTSLRDAQAIL